MGERVLSMNNRRGRSQILSLFAVAIVTNLVWEGWVPTVKAAASPPTFIVQTVTRSTVQKVTPLAGNVISRSTASVTYSGQPTVVERVLVKTGTAVSKGQVLATMANGTNLAAPFAGTVVNVALTAGDTVPGTGSSTATGTQLSSQSATSSGRMGAGGSSRGYSQLSNGQSVSNQVSTLSITIADTQHNWVQAQVDQQTVHWISKGDPVQLVLVGEPGILYTGAVVQVSQVTTTNSAGAVTYPVDISLTVAPGQPKPLLGMSVQAFVQVDASTGISVPVDALSQRANGQYVVTMASGQMRAVTLGLVGLNSAILTSGLTLGEAIRLPSYAKQTGSQPVPVMVMPG